MFAIVVSLVLPSCTDAYNSPEQSISCCSESDTRIFVLSACNPSRLPVVEKDQHEPHFPYICCIINQFTLK